MRPRPTSLELKQFASLVSSEFTAATNLSEKVDEASLDYHGITTLALRSGLLEPPLAAKLAHRIPLAIASEALRSKALLELSAAFSKAGVEPLMFKGTALAYRYYPEPWLRPRTDTDLLIEHQHLDMVNQIFSSLGYQKLFAIEGNLVSYQATFSKALSNKSGLNIDLHWRISNRQILSRSFNLNELQQRSPIERILGFKTLSLVDHVLVACQHRVGHHHREERLTWLYDIHLLIKNFTYLDWQHLVELAEVKQIKAITANALMICHEIFGSVIPPEPQAKLLIKPTKKEPSAIFLRREISEWRLFWYELAALPSLSLKLQWCVETLLPNAEYVRTQMQEDSLLKAHLKRWWRGLKRVVN